MMAILNDALQTYIENHTEAESPLLKKISRETYTKVLMPRMLSGHFQGRVLSMLSHMIKPKRILEIGTFTGYSAICLAEGMDTEGEMVTVDKNDELESRVRQYFKEANLEDAITYLLGDAMQLIPTLNGGFDLVFIDADKINYIHYYDMVFDKVNKGGYFIIDNVLWSGKVVPEGRSKKIDKDTQAILDFNERVHKDMRVQNVLFPIRDGLMILRKL